MLGDGFKESKVYQKTIARHIGNHAVVIRWPWGDHEAMSWSAYLALFPWRHKPTVVFMAGSGWA